jgi:hypothetical protein
MDEPIKPFSPKGDLKEAFCFALDGIRRSTVADWMWKANQNSARQVKARKRCKRTFVCNKKARPKYGN